MTRILSFLLLALCAGFVACNNTGVRPDSLEAHSWVLAAYQEDGKEQPVTDQATHLQFADGKLSGNTGCNQIDGSYELKQSRLTTSGVFTTKMACAGMMEREARLTWVLNGEPTLALTNEELLMSFDGSVLVFRAVSEVRVPKPKDN